MFDLAARRQLNRGYSDGLSRAVEIVVTPLLFGYAGHLLDGWLGIRPVMTIALAALAVTGLFVKLWLGYDREMRRHEEGAVWARSQAAAQPAATPATAQAATAPDVPGVEPGGGGSS